MNLKLMAAVAAGMTRTRLHAHKQILQNRYFDSDSFLALDERIQDCQSDQQCLLCASAEICKGIRKRENAKGKYALADASVEMYSMAPIALRPCNPLLQPPQANMEMAERRIVRDF